MSPKSAATLETYLSSPMGTSGITYQNISKNNDLIGGLELQKCIASLMFSPVGTILRREKDESDLGGASSRATMKPLS
jgi:hypothetical protein